MGEIFVLIMTVHFIGEPQDKQRYETFSVYTSEADCNAGLARQNEKFHGDKGRQLLKEMKIDRWHIDCRVNP